MRQGFQPGAFQRSKKNCSGSVSLPIRYLGSETSDATHRLRQPTTNLQLGDAPVSTPVGLGNKKLSRNSVS